MKIKEYKIITDGNLYELQAVVNQHISQGWVPLGGVSVGFHQTMVLYEEEPPASNFQFDKHGCLIIRACGEDPQASD